MTALDDVLLPAVKAIISSVGVAMTAATITTDTYDPSTGETTQDSTDASFTASPLLQYNLKQIDGELILSGDTKIVIAGQDATFTPIRDMRITFDSVSWKIVSVKTIYSGESIAAWICQMRK